MIPKQHNRAVLLCLLAAVLFTFFYTRRERNQKAIEAAQKQLIIFAAEEKYKASKENLPFPLRTRKRLAIGFSHACIVSFANNINCYGQNSFGQVGTEEDTGAEKRMYVVWSISPASQVDAGWNHTCAIGKNDDLFCWGNNEHGQLGTDPQKINKTSQPQQIVEIGKVKALGMGKNFSCAINMDGQAYCWGENTSGQLGDGEGKSVSFRPVAVKGLKNLIDIDGGETSACAIDQSGDVYCWGKNDFGQLGTGDTKPQAKPNKVKGLPLATSIKVDKSHTCALTKEQEMWCWGNNQTGQLGTGDKLSSMIPHKVSGINKVVSISTGLNHSCVLNQDGQMYCWGYFSADNDKDPGVTCYGSYLSPIRTGKTHPIIADISSSLQSDWVRLEPFGSGYIHFGSWGDDIEPSEDEAKGPPGFANELAHASKFLKKNQIHFLIGISSEDGHLGVTCTYEDCKGDMLLIEPDGKFSEMVGDIKDLNQTIDIEREWGGGNYKVAYIDYKKSKKKEGNQEKFGSLNGEFSFVLVGENLKKNIKKIHWEPASELKESEFPKSCPVMSGYKLYRQNFYKAEGKTFYRLVQLMDNDKYNDEKYTYDSMGIVEDGKCTIWYDSYSAYEAKVGTGRELDDAFPSQLHGMLTLDDEKWMLYQAYGYEWSVTALIPLPAKGKRIDFNKVSFFDP